MSRVSTMLKSDRPVFEKCDQSGDNGPGELNHRDHDQSVAPKKINKRTDPLYTGNNLKRGPLANSEGPAEMPQSAALHKGLHYLK